ncbi:dihydrolipoyl dehydrogenase family protein [Bacillus piscicola]|uniref:dihydrolipoyl dehydrogenase family protein n=1 Tax=Bacillus piscicola TaxID=1632684 RepID=UPI001F0918E8
MVVGDFAHEKDVIVIGGGPGGYHAAIRAAQLGKEVAVIEKEAIGGICLNNGCISSKLFAEAAKRMRDTADAQKFGIQQEPVTFDLPALQEQKASVIANLTTGVKTLLKKHNIEVIQGEATFLANNQIGVEHGEAFDKYQFEQAVIATGARYRRPTGFETESERILDPSTIYETTELPDELFVYGSDYQAVEVASTFSAFGSKVTWAFSEILPYDPAITKELIRLMKKHKIKVLKNTELRDITPQDNHLEIIVNAGEEEQVRTASHVFLSCKQQANTEAIRVEAAGIEVSDDGFIPITETAQTNQPHIYAVGDVTTHSFYAVEAIKQGKTAGERIAGENSEWDPYALPNITHSIRPIAFVGLTEEEAKQEGFDVLVGDLPLAGNGYATLMNKKEGIIKVISEKESDLILGVHAIGEGSIEMISQAVLALEMGARDEDLTYPYYPHPSLNEAWLEAAEALKDKAIHRA